MWFLACHTSFHYHLIFLFAHLLKRTDLPPPILFLLYLHVRPLWALPCQLTPTAQCPSCAAVFHRSCWKERMAAAGACTLCGHPSPSPSPSPSLRPDGSADSRLSIAVGTSAWSGSSLLAPLTALSSLTRKQLDARKQGQAPGSAAAAAAAAAAARGARAGDSRAAWGASGWLNGWMAGRPGGRPLQMEALELRVNDVTDGARTSEDALSAMEGPSSGKGLSHQE